MNETVKILVEADNLENLNLGIQLVDSIKEEVTEEEMARIIDKIEKLIVTDIPTQEFLAQNTSSFGKWMELYNYFYQKKNKKAKKL